MRTAERVVDADLAELAASLPTPLEDGRPVRAYCIVESTPGPKLGLGVHRYRVAWGVDSGRRREPIGPAFTDPRDAYRLAALLNARSTRAPEPAVPPRTCLVCGAPLPARSRAHREVCSGRCRVRRFRARGAGATGEIVTSPEDPPLPGAWGRRWARPAARGAGAASERPATHKALHRAGPGAALMGPLPPHPDSAASDRPARPNGASGHARPARQRYELRDATGALVAIHERIDAADGSKRFLWRGPDGTLGLGDRSTTDLPLYGIERLDGFAPLVVVTEGEKAAEALLDRGIAAVGTVTGASGCPSIRALGELAGRHVRLWPDADAPGRRHMETLAARLVGIVASVALIEPSDGVPPGWDAADAVAEGRDIGAIIAGAGPYVSPARDVSPDPAAAAPRVDEPVILRLADVEAEPVEWLWPGYIPSGMLSLLDGDPGVGKSTLTDDLAARVSTGRPMPDGTGGGEPRGVVILSAEDDLARTVVPRLAAAGADLGRIVTVGLRDRDGGTRAPLITPTDLAIVERAVRDTGARLLIVDPLVAYLPDEINTNRDHDVRRALRALAELAERTGCAVIAVRHLRKGAAENPLYRGGGSIGIIAAARAAFLLARDPDDAERRVFAPLKLNVAPEPPARAFRLMVEPGRAHPRVAWEGVSPLDAQALLAVPADAEERSALDEAADVLRTILADGPVRADKAQQLARKAGVAERTIARARRALGVVARKVGRPGDPGQHWEWSLPPKGANPARSTPTSEVGALRPALAAFGAPTATDASAVEADYPRSAWAVEPDDG